MRYSLNDGPIEELISLLKMGDELVVQRVEDLGLTMKQVARTIDAARAGMWNIQIQEAGVCSQTKDGFSYLEGFLAAARFHHHVQSRRSKEGIEQARKRGRKGGRPPSMSKADVMRAKEILLDQRFSVGEVAAQMQVSKATLERYLVLYPDAPAQASLIPGMLSNDD